MDFKALNGNKFLIWITLNIIKINIKYFQSHAIFESNDAREIAKAYKGLKGH